MSYQQKTLGIIGGGQLGKMLIQAAADLNIQCKVLDNDPNAPCSVLTNQFFVGKLTDFEAVHTIGQNCDAITIEIENINADALEKLQEEGIKVFPKPQHIKLFQDKRLQKQFYKDKNIPTADFVLTENRQDLEKYTDFLPAIHKLGKEGYDGRGVAKIQNPNDFEKGFDAPSVLEKWIDFDKELAVTVARNESGQISVFPVVEMVFNPVYNLVEYLFSPAQIDEKLAAKAQEIAKKIVQELDFVGILAVEMFLKGEQIWVNEAAPRPHNSGHQSIEGNYTSQYEQLLRAIFDLPLGNTDTILPAAMLNLLGEPQHTGQAVYEGIEQILAMQGVYVHLYGKAQTKPFRKMGHITILGKDIHELEQKVSFVKEKIKVVSV